MDVRLTVSKDYYNDMMALSKELEGNRVGFQEVDVHFFGNSPVRILLNRDNLYVEGFYSAGSGNWYRFKEQTWPATMESTEFPISGHYSALGGLHFKISASTIPSIGNLNRYAGGTVSAEHTLALRHVTVGISEALRFADVITWMMAVLLTGQSFDVRRLEDLIKDWKTNSRVKRPGLLLLHTNPG